MGYAILFPGQGSQAVGMCQDVIEARPDLFGEAAAAVLGWDMESTVRFGPTEVLTQTDRSQPALYSTCSALWEAFAARVTESPAAAAGHSLGEYTALFASGAIGYWEGLRTVADRGRAMAAASTENPSSMAALMGIAPEVAQELAAKRREAGGALWVANLNSPGQVVMSGSKPDIAWLVDNAQELGVRRAMELAVAGGFHSPLMEDAASALNATLEKVEFGPSAFPVYSNVTAAPTQDVKASLIRQLTSPVRFSESIDAMATAGIDTFVHIGPGEVTVGLVKRIVKSATTYVVSSLDEAASVASQLASQ